jgi:wyosine [tRNA(Phe)-imidazoG37] synthetase (radical SAM superfamily)
MFDKNEYNESIAKRLSLNSLEDCLYFPQYFEIETIRACNAKCIICTIDEWENKGKVMDDSLFKKFTEEVKNYSNWIKTICLCRDGEPTLDKYLPERVFMLKEAGIKKVTISSNGQLLTEKLAEKLIKNGLDDIMLSIDGIKKETFEKIRMGLNYETVIKNTLQFFELRDRLNSPMTIRIRMAVIDENREEVDEWLAFWKDKIGEKDRAYAMPVHSWGNQKYRESEHMVMLYAHKPCVSPFSSLAMHVDGKIGICAADYKVKHLMGDFTKETIKDIWAGEAFMKARMLHVGKKRNEIDICMGCHIWDREYNE